MPAGSSRSLHILLGGGGTGGHVFPAVAIGAELARRGCRVSFAGSSRGMEARLIVQRGWPFHSLASRPLVGRSLLERGLALAVVAGSAWRARRLIRREGVAAVVGTGGYVSAPVVLGARLAGRPVLLVEPNVRAGVANRWLSRWASGALVAYPETLVDFRCPAWVTGVPVREEFFAVPGELPPAPPLQLLVLGGSQGARQLNRLLPEALGSVVSTVGPVQVLHQAGERHLEEARAAYDRHRTPGVEVAVVPFLDDVARAMAGCHLVISRAGALTLAEICAAGRPSLLVPLALVAGHQMENARRLAAAGAAETLEPEEATPERMGDVLARLLANRGTLEAMARAARGLARPRAVQEIAEKILAVAQDRRVR